MRRLKAWLFHFGMSLVLISGAFPAVPRVHVITFGKWMTVPWLPGLEGSKPLTLKVRPLLIDGRVKEYAVGLPHDVTDRLFVVRRAFRLNDSLPDEPGSSRWQWQRGGWLLIDRLMGRISAINLPDFDAYYSAGAWYRDYFAYCAVSDDGKKIYALVAQVTRRKPVLKKMLSNEGVSDEAAPDSACPVPSWQRTPTRVTFETTGASKQTFAIRGHVVDLVSDAEDEDEEASR